LCEKCDDIITCAGSGHHLRPGRIEPGAPYFGKSLFSKISANNKHSLLQIIPIHFPTILCELTHYSNTHEQQPYCVGTLSQMSERSAERRVRQETGWLAGGPLLRVPTIRHTTDTSRFISYTTNVLLFKFRYNVFIGVRIIKEMPGSVASGTPCIIPYLQVGSRTMTFCTVLFLLICNNRKRVICRGGRFQIF
jgi:hypothetical protein